MKSLAPIVDRDLKPATVIQLRSRAEILATALPIIVRGRAVDPRGRDHGEVVRRHESIVDAIAFGVAETAALEDRGDR